jgi:hypothetical protein
MIITWNFSEETQRERRNNATVKNRLGIRRAINNALVMATTISINMEHGKTIGVTRKTRFSFTLFLPVD